jgi:hypothetical protein
MSSTLDTVSQGGLTVFSVAAILLVAKKNKWGFVVGLLSEPFWFITSYLNKQWGIFILSVVYTGTWAFGIYEWFYKDKDSAK